MITKQALGNLLFGMADILRDKVEDYKSYILSLLFFKRLSDNYQWKIENGREQFVVDYMREPSPKKLGVVTKKKYDFTIPQGCFWEDVRLASIDKKNEKLDKAVTDIAELDVDKNGKYILKGIINTVRWNEPAPDGSGGKSPSWIWTILRRTSSTSIFRVMWTPLNQKNRLTSSKPLPISRRRCKLRLQ